MIGPCWTFSSKSSSTVGRVGGSLVAAFLQGANRKDFYNVS